MQEHSEFCETCFKPYIPSNSIYYNPTPLEWKISCKVCHKSAHKYCYMPGLEEQGEFVCDVCREGSKKQAVCVVCRQGGLLKRVDEFYVHVVCASFSAMFMPASFNTLSFIRTLPSSNQYTLKKTKSFKKCDVCHISSSIHYLIKCTIKNCRNYVHIYCLKKSANQQNSQSQSIWRESIGNLNHQPKNTGIQKTVEPFKYFIRENYPGAYEAVWTTISSNKAKIGKLSKSDFFCKSHSHSSTIECFCGREENNYIECDKCLSWTHVKCQCLSINQSQLLNDTNSFFECKQCLKWREVVQRNKRPLLKYYPQMHFYDLVYIQKYYETKKYSLSENDEKLLERVQLKPSLKFYTYFALTEIYPKTKKRIQVDKLKDSSQGKLNEYRKGTTRKHEREEKIARESFVLINLLMADSFQLGEIQKFIAQNRKIDRNQIGGLLEKFESSVFQRKKINQFSVIFGISEVSEEDPIVKAEEIHLSQEENSQNDKNIRHEQLQYQVYEEYPQERNSSKNKHFEPDYLSTLLQLACQIQHSPSISTRKTKLTQFKSILKKCSLETRKKAINLLHYLENGHQKTANIFHQQKIKTLNSSDFISFGVVLKYIDECLDDRNYCTHDEVEERVARELRENKDRYFVYLSEKERKSVCIFESLRMLKEKVRKNQDNKQANRNNLKFLETIKITEHNLRYIFEFFQSISQISLTHFPSLSNVLMSIAQKLVATNKKQMIYSEQHYYVYKYFTTEFGIRETWVFEELRVHEKIKKFIDSFDVNAVMDKESCIGWKKKMKEMVIKIEREGKKKAYQKELMKIFQCVDCLYQVFDGIPLWMLFPQKIQPHTPTTTIKAKKIIQIANYLQKKKFPSSNIKTRIQELMDLIDEETKLISQFLLQLNSNVAKIKSYSESSIQYMQFSLKEVDEALAEMQDSFIDHSQLISEVQEVIKTFIEYRCKYYRAVQKNRKEDLEQIMHEMRAFPIEMSQVICAYSCISSRIEQYPENETKLQLDSRNSEKDEEVHIKNINRQQSLEEPTQFKFNSVLGQQNMERCYKGVSNFVVKAQNGGSVLANE